MSKYTGLVNYYSTDFPRTLFPLETNRSLIKHSAEQLDRFIVEEITAHEENGQAFSPQVTAHASKHGPHTRRTLKLDPVAEFYIYSAVFAQRQRLTGIAIQGRNAFGYAFNGASETSPSFAYQAFKAQVYQLSRRYRHHVKFDISSYFNSIYHHDLVSWFGTIADGPDVQLFGKYFRQIAGGRSIDFLPHGLSPSKILGNHFLRYIHESVLLRSEVLIRFMDDFYLFSDHERAVLDDFTLIESLLGQRSLNINAAKTVLGDVRSDIVQESIDRTKLELLQIRRQSGSSRYEEEDGDGDNNDSEATPSPPLNGQQLDLLYSLLKDPGIVEEDAELVLSLMADHSEDVLEYVPTFLERFPALIKNVYRFCLDIDDINGLSDAILGFVRGDRIVPEHQLFWLIKLLEDKLLASGQAGNLFIAFLDRTGSYELARAKLLEIPESRFGMPDIREGILNNGNQGWAGWASATGCREMQPDKRNYLLKYFGNASSINRLVADSVASL